MVPVSDKPPIFLPTLSAVAAHWLSSLKKIQKENTVVSVPPRSKKEELVYILRVVENYHVKTFEVELVVSYLLKKGGYGASKQFSSTRQSHQAVLTEEDRFITHNLEVMEKTAGIFNRHYFFGSHYFITGQMAQDILERILKTNRCYWEEQSGPRVYLAEALKGEFSWEFLGNGNGTQKLICKPSDGVDRVVLGTRPLYYLEIDQLEGNKTAALGLLVTEFDLDMAAHFIASPALSYEEAKLLHETVAILPPPKNIKIESKKGTPTPCLRLTPDKKRIFSDDEALAIISFKYDDIEKNIELKNNKTIINTYVSDSTMLSIERDLLKETEFLSVIRQMKVVEPVISSGVFVIGLPFVVKDLPILREQNWIIEIEENFPFNCVEEEEWYTEVEDKTQYDWFGFELGILIEGKKINILPLLVKLISQNQNMLNADNLDKLPDDHQFYLELPDKRYVAVEAKRIKNILFVLVELYDSKLTANGKMKVDYFQSAQLLGLQQALKARWMGDQKLQQLGEKLIDFKGIQPCVVPKNLKGTLRTYQKEGIDWLNFLREFQLGGILADDMGLGKTIQVLTHLLAEKEAGRQTHPNLIIAPTSLMANWYKEGQRFTPDLNMLILQGHKRQLDFDQVKHADVVLSTYPLIVRDKDILLKQQFHYLILDEAQYIKNPKTKCYQELLEIKSHHTLCMTGTPMENHLGELWALFNFTAPGLLGEDKKFKKLFRDPIEKEGDLTRQKSLAQRIRPFMLRRTKEEVATELPAKTEIIHSIELKGAQLDLYEGIRLAMQEKVQNAVQKKGFAGSQIVILDALLKLRQTCNDPKLLPLEKAKKMNQSAKREFLLEMLDTLIEEGRKILLFSSFASMLNILEQDLIDRKINYVMLTGQTRDRVTPVNQFQEGDAVVMLISLKAGGVGLNLTAADTVIHYDPWWNPAAESQATDRAHRIGQTKPVFVYKLVCKGTVEEKILQMQENKRQLSKGLFTSGEHKNLKMSAKDLAYLFEPLA